MKWQRLSTKNEVTDEELNKKNILETSRRIADLLDDLGVSYLIYGTTPNMKDPLVTITDLTNKEILETIKEAEKKTKGGEYERYHRLKN